MGLQPVEAGQPRFSTSTPELPNYVVPPFNSIGANEYIVDVTHEVPGVHLRVDARTNSKGIGRTGF
jgi:hypothetical protein